MGHGFRETVHISSFILWTIKGFSIVLIVSVGGSAVRVVGKWSNFGISTALLGADRGLGTLRLLSRFGSTALTRLLGRRLGASATLSRWRLALTTFSR